jgi:hypothetical protein
MKIVSRSKVEQSTLGIDGWVEGLCFVVYEGVFSVREYLLFI